MWVEVGIVTCRVARATPDERAWIESYLTFTDDKARFKKKRKSADDNSMLEKVTGTFLSGLLPAMRRAAKEQNVTIELIDRRFKPCEPSTTADLSWLYDYQREAVERVIKHSTGILWLPTAAGKTQIAIGLTLKIPCRWLFLVHKRDLMHQTAESYEARTGHKAGRIGDGEWSVGTFTVATFQTVASALSGPRRAKIEAFLATFGGVIVDECHVLPAGSFSSVMRKVSHAYYRVGLSGTPLARGDQRSLHAIALLGPIIYKLRPDVLIEAGVLAKPRIRLAVCNQRWDGMEPEFEDVDDDWAKPVVTSATKEWRAVYRALVVESEPRNNILVELTKRAAKPALLFVKEIDHGELLLERVRAAGLEAEFVWGTTETERRKAAVKRLVRADIDVLICSVIFQEGTDIPSLASVIVGSGGKSVIAAIQRVGRGMRSDGGRKSEFEVWDIADKGSKWMERHARARTRAYIAEGYETVMMSGTNGGTQMALTAPTD